MPAFPSGYEIPVHRALTEPIMLGGSPRALAIVNGTIAGAVAIGLRMWIIGIVLGLAGHGLAVWIGRRDPQFVEVARRHIRYPTVMIP